MRRRVTQVTTITKTVDNRLKALEKKLQKIEDYIISLEKLLPMQPSSKGTTKTSTITYTIKKKS
jgi:hypothetical protein